MSKVRHVLGISGGKDSTALAIYLKNRYPELDIEYYFCDTGKELDETYKLLENLEIFLGKKIKQLKSIDYEGKAPFDHHLEIFGGFLPSSNARWCTQKLKLEPFEKYVGSDPVISYVGIRGDEDREGYISKKSNIQSIFPFRKNIWSEDVIHKALSNENIDLFLSVYLKQLKGNNSKDIIEAVERPISYRYSVLLKKDTLLSLGVKEFNKAIFEFLKTTDYPLSASNNFPLVENDDVLMKEDILKILKESGVGIPEYYNEIEFKVNGSKGFYKRSRSGCFFCFFQQKIEWIWLYENHKDQFLKAMEYEKEGYTWMQDESLAELIEPERLAQIKQDFIKKTKRGNLRKSEYLLDILEDDNEGCAACFI